MIFNIDKYQFIFLQIILTIWIKTYYTMYSGSKDQKANFVLWSLKGGRTDKIISFMFL